MSNLLIFIDLLSRVMAKKYSQPQILFGFESNVIL